MGTDEHVCLEYIQQLCKRVEDTGRIANQVSKGYEHSLMGTLDGEVLLYGISDSDERIMQVDALVNARRKLTRRSTATCVVLSGNVLTLAIMSSHLAMHRWRVLEAQTSFEASEALRQEALEAERILREAQHSAASVKPQTKSQKVSSEEGNITSKDTTFAFSRDIDSDVCELSTDNTGETSKSTSNIETASASLSSEVIPYLVIIDAYTHEVLPDIICQLRSLESQFNMMLTITVMMHAGYQSRLPGMVVFPKHAPTLKEVYNAGCDLALCRCFDHKVVAFFTEMFTSAVGRWQADMGQQLSGGNYAIMKTAFGSTLDQYDDEEPSDDFLMLDKRQQGSRIGCTSPRGRADGAATLRSPLRGCKVAFNESVCSSRMGGCRKRPGIPKDFVGSVMRPALRSKRLDKTASHAKPKRLESSFGDTIRTFSSVWDDDEVYEDTLLDETEELESAAIAAYQRELSELLTKQEEYEQTLTALTEENERLHAAQELVRSPWECSSSASSDQGNSPDTPNYLKKEQQIHMLKERLMEVAREHGGTHGVMFDRPRPRRKLGKKSPNGKQGALSKSRLRKPTLAMTSPNRRRLNHVQLLESALMSYHDVPAAEDDADDFLLESATESATSQFDALGAAKADALQSEISAIETLLQEARNNGESLCNEKYEALLKSTSKVSWGVGQLSDKCARLQRELHRARESVLEKSFVDRRGEKDVGGASTKGVPEGKKALSRKSSFASGGLCGTRGSEPLHRSRTSSAAHGLGESRKSWAEAPKRIAMSARSRPTHFAESSSAAKGDKQIMPLRRVNSIRFREHDSEAQSTHQTGFRVPSNLKLAESGQLTLSDGLTSPCEGKGQSMTSGTVNSGDWSRPVSQSGSRLQRPCSKGSLVVDGTSLSGLGRISPSWQVSIASLRGSGASERSKRLSPIGPGTLHAGDANGSQDFGTRLPTPAEHLWQRQQRHSQREHVFADDRPFCGTGSTTDSGGDQSCANYLSHHEALGDFLRALCCCYPALQPMLQSEVVALESLARHGSAGSVEAGQESRVAGHEGQPAMALDTKLLLRLSERLLSSMSGLADNNAGSPLTNTMYRATGGAVGNDTRGRGLFSAKSTGIDLYEGAVSEGPVARLGRNLRDRVTLPPLHRLPSCGGDRSEIPFSGGCGQQLNDGEAPGSALKEKLQALVGAESASFDRSSLFKPRQSVQNVAHLSDTESTAPVSPPPWGQSVSSKKSSVRYGRNLQPFRWTQRQGHTEPGEGLDDGQGPTGDDYTGAPGTAVAESLVDIYRNFWRFSMHCENLRKELFDINCEGMPREWRDGCISSPQFILSGSGHGLKDGRSLHGRSLFALPVASANLRRRNRSPRRPNALRRLSRAWNFGEFCARTRSALMRYSLLVEHLNTTSSPRGGGVQDGRVGLCRRAGSLTPRRHVGTRRGTGTTGCPTLRTNKNLNSSPLVIVGKNPPSLPTGRSPSITPRTPPHGGMRQGGDKEKMSPR